MHTKYPHMFSPIKIGDIVFKNRVWSAPAGTHLLAGNEDYPNEAVIAYYAAKARGGSANITFSAQNMDIYSQPAPGHAKENIFKRENHQHWRQLTDTVHFYGAKISLELLAFDHHGYDFSGKLVKYAVNEGRMDHSGKPMPQMTRLVMEHIAQKYAEAADCALACGFDMILVHGGHGLILSQFLSPVYNTRTDEFGGSLENRLRFPLMVLDAIRDRVGRKLLIEYRISGSELSGDTGFDIRDCIEALKVFQGRIDIAHVSCGSFFNNTEHITHPTNFLPAGCNAYLAAEVKRCPEIKIPVLTLGGFQSPDLIEETIASGGADLVAMARGSIADACLVQKSQNGRENEIIPCIRCFHCLDYTRAESFTCSVNPTVGRETRLPLLIPPKSGKKRIVIIGGGPAGMEAAITAAHRGHEVTLIERNELGGKLLFSRYVKFKRDLRKFMEYQIHMVNKLDINILTGTEAAPEMVRNMSPDAVIAALGSRPIIPSIIPGVDGAHVMTAEECYDITRQGKEIGEHAVILGGGLVGCETALYLAEQLGKKVALIEMLPEVAMEEFYITRTALLERMEDMISCYTRARCSGITPDGLTFVDHRGNEQIIRADSVVLAVGMSPRNEPAELFRDTAPYFMTVGDCIRAGNVRAAVRTAYDAAIQL